MKRRLVLATLLWSLFLAIGGAVAGAPDPGPRSPVIIPEQQIGLIFDHSRHLQQGLQCRLCHGMVATSTQSADRNIPDHRTCGICHFMQVPDAAERFPKSGCQHCHSGFLAGAPDQLAPDKLPLAGSPRPAPTILPPSRIHFSHKNHLDRGTECRSCHAAMDKVQLATRAQLPSMMDCLECHNGRQAPSACTLCHLAGDGGLVRTDLDGAALRPSGRFRPDDHGRGDWLKQHEVGARGDVESCRACHAQTFCLDCHDGVQKPAFHPGGWVATHALEANLRTSACEGCHDPTLFCQTCHGELSVRPGAFPSPTGEEPGNRRFHPADWGGIAGEIPTAEHHSHQARRSLETCRACHEEADCATCHAFVSPHPKSWAEGEGWKAPGDGAVCLQCHAPGER